MVRTSETGRADGLAVREGVPASSKNNVLSCQTPEILSTDFKDLSSGLSNPESALDRSLTITKFSDAKAARKLERSKSLRELAPIILNRTAPQKEALPWLKLAAFGNVSTTRGSLRHNANLLTVDGIEGDHDAGTLTIEEASARLRSAGVAGLFYTSPSNTPEKPRWRVLCPTSRPLPKEAREALCARLNGLLDGELAPESFSLSQAYFYGSVAGNTAHRVELIDGQAIDSADGLDAAARGRDGKPYVPAPVAVEAEPFVEEDDDDGLSVEPLWGRIGAALDSIPASARDDREGYWRPVVSHRVV